MSDAVKDALYIAVVIVLAIVFIKILWQFGVLILLIAGGYYIYKKYIKKEDNELF
ncbi:MAG: hypothetical protein HYZ16_09235 [Bacteroidetes bacterium]|jgi:hypothetical protein|nr:hypothetical protein [Bacteroidota bacterium]